MPGGRLVITEATREAREWVGGAGLVRVLDEGGMVVGAGSRPGWGAAVDWAWPLKPGLPAPSFSGPLAGL